MSLAENFLYPLGLLIIGGGITAGLIPWFNSVHKQKLMEIEHSRELSQKRIDREREDHKFELTIKNNFFSKLSEENSWCYTTIKKLGNNKGEKRTQLLSEALDFMVIMVNSVEDILTLYFENAVEIHEQRKIFVEMIGDGLLLACTSKKSDNRRNKIEEFNKKFNIKMSKEEIEESMDDEQPPFEPIYQISARRKELNRLMLQTKINLPYRD